MQETTRRTFFGLISLSPFAWFWGGKKKDVNESIRVQRENTMLRYHAAQSDYWRKRCFAAEGDLEQRESVIDLAIGQFKVDPSSLAVVFQCDSENKVYHILNCGQRPQSHPDCMKESKLTLLWKQVFQSTA